MADDNYALTFAKVNQETLTSTALSGAGADPAGAARLEGGFAGLRLALVDASVELRNLTAEQIQLRDVLGSIHEVLTSQRSLQQAINDRQAQLGATAAGSEQKIPRSADAGDLPPKRLQTTIELDAAMVKLGRVEGLDSHQRQSQLVMLEKMATEEKVAAGGTTALDLIDVKLAAARAGVGRPVDDKGNVDPAAGRKNLVDFTLDTGVTATAFGMKALDTADMLIGWRTSMSLERPETLDLADAVTVLGGSLSAPMADIGAILGSYGASGKRAGLSVEESAAFSAALLNAGVNRADAGVAFEKIITTLALGDKATPSQQAAMVQLGFNPETLAAKMKADAPDAIQQVLEALKKQNPDKQLSSSKALFTVDRPIIQLLENTGEVQRAFSLVADKQSYASSARGEEGGALNQASLAQSNTSQASWNALDASLDRFSAAFGNALAPLTDGAAVVLTTLVKGVSAAAEALPALTAGLVLLGAAALPFVGGALKLGVASVLDLVAKKLLRLASTRLPADIADAITGDDDGNGRRKKKRSGRGPGRRSLSRAPARATVPRVTGGGRLAGMTAKVAPLFDQVKIGVKLWADDIAGSKLSSRLKGPVAKLAPLAESLGAKVMPSVAKALPFVKVGAPLAIAHAAYSGLKGWREGDEKAVKGAAGELAGTAIGATIGTFIAPGIGTFIGGTLGAMLGSYLGEKLATPPEDKLAPPAQVAKDLSSAQTQNQQITYAPSIQISGSEVASSEKVGAMISQVMQNHFNSQFIPTMNTNPLATRRDAALTDGVA
ncbi:phage tail tape measure protein [Pseudomonas sp. RA_105y_Pfl2_P56]|uniref:phage tail tape measure protein n=1 Tax=Pseudomonas sp. RA_105y_Pfl2_P56 TaxID=3088701 RepID=UPI0030DB95D3